MPYTLHHEHAWDVTSKEAVALQKKLAAEVREEPLTAPPETIAGVDVSIREDPESSSGQAFAQAAISVLALPELAVVDEVIHRCDVPFLYVPGLLSFREMPAILPALEELTVWPDVFMPDSQGRAHPRRFGLACHLGVLLDAPALGVAKSRLTGRPEEELPEEKGAHVPLVDKSETVGALVRTRANVKPVYVSVGHRMTLEEAVDLTLACAPRYKIPVPTREAHALSRREA